MSARVTLVLALLGGCFKPSPTEGFACGPDRWCPDPLSCAADNTCRSKDVDDPGDGGPGVEGLPPGPANVAFVTSMTYTPLQVAGVAGADAICTALGAGIGKPGRYVAWLSTIAAPAAQRLGGASGWRRTDGQPFARSKQDLLAGRILYPLRRDENGQEVVGEVMTGTVGDGSATENCLELTSGSSTELMLIGTSDGGTNRWTNTSEGACNLAYHMYCLQADTSTTVESPPTGSLRAFLSSPFTPGGGGIGSADTLCMNDAAANGIPGEFRAFLSTTGNAATVRVTSTGAPWVRVDEVETTTNFFAYEGGISVTADGTYLDVPVYSGAPNPEQKSASFAESCNDWTGGTTAVTGTSARAIRGEAFGGSSGGCGATRVYCLEKR